MKFGLPISFALHALMVSGGVMLWQERAKTVEAAKIIPLEIVTVSDYTNVKPTRTKPVETPKPLPDTVETIQPEVPPEIIKTEPKPIVTPTPEKTSETTPEVPKPEKPTEVVAEKPAEPAKETPTTPSFNLDSFSDMVDKSRTDNPDANTQITLTGDIEQAKQNQNGAGDHDGMTVSPTDYIRAKMEPCWHIDKGAKDYQGLRVEITLDLNDKGEIDALKIRNGAQIIASGSTSWRAARENVVAALNECAPYDGLMAQQYETWKTMKLNFQPGDI